MSYSMPKEIPQIVYKYRDWNNSFHKNILLHNEIYLASPKDFNDPFDCKIPRNFQALNTEEIESFKEDLANEQRPKYSGTDIEFRRIRKDLDNRMEDIEKFQNEYEDKYFNQMDAYYGILSLSRIYNGILLWAHYGSNHTGFCVGFWEEKLRLFYPRLNRTGCVIYKSKFPELKPKIEKDKEEQLNRIHTQTTTKSLEWKNEKEYRLIKAFKKPPLPFQRCVNIPDEVFSDVTLGINISQEDKEEIIQICRKKRIPVYQATKVPFKFEIDRELIE